jgi:tetratricopeptide (TPR) repeat protein
MQYEISLQCRPGYPYALSGMGRVAIVYGEFDKAIAFLSQADRSLSEHSFKEELADLYELTGKNDKADSIIHWLINDLVKETKNEGRDSNLVQNEDGEFVHVYLKSGEIDKALQHALNDFNRRPSNIQVNETLAWVYYIKKDYDKALSYLETAMKTKSKNPVLLCRAGLIYAKTENREKAKLLLGELKNVNCSVPLPLKKLGLQELKTL